MKVGVSLNFNNLCGDYCGKSVQINEHGDLVDKAAYQALLGSVDYLGISGHGWTVA